MAPAAAAEVGGVVLSVLYDLPRAAAKEKMRKYETSSRGMAPRTPASVHVTDCEQAREAHPLHKVRLLLIAAYWELIAFQGRFL